MITSLSHDRKNRQNLMMHGLTQNVRYSLRQIRKSSGFAAITVITLALGIGGNSAIFGVINAVMLRTLPVKDPGRLVLLKWKAKRIPKNSQRYLKF